MFDRLEHHAARLASRRADARAREAAALAEEALPAGVKSQLVAEGVRLTGRRLRRRFALEPALRWLVARLK